MNNRLVVNNIEKEAKKEKRLQLAKVGGLVLSSIIVNNLNYEILSFFKPMLSLYSVYEFCNYLVIKGKNDYIIKQEQAKTLMLRKGE